LPIPGNLLTTAMAVMPHTDPAQALEVALSMDIPFWPQFPRLSYYEAMYVQASEHFPGIILNLDNQTLAFSMDKFVVELEDSLAHFEEPAYFDISAQYSDVYLNGDIFTNYAGSIKRFLDSDGVIVWGLVPTNFEPFEAENAASLKDGWFATGDIARIEPADSVDFTNSYWFFDAFWFYAFCMIGF